MVVRVVGALCVNKCLHKWSADEIMSIRVVLICACYGLCVLSWRWIKENLSWWTQYCSGEFYEYECVLWECVCVWRCVKVSVGAVLEWWTCGGWCADKLLWLCVHTCLCVCDTWFLQSLGVQSFSATTHLTHTSHSDPHHATTLRAT